MHIINTYVYEGIIMSKLKNKLCTNYTMYTKDYHGLYAVENIEGNPNSICKTTCPRLRHTNAMHAIMHGTAIESLNVALKAATHCVIANKFNTCIKSGG